MGRLAMTSLQSNMEHRALILGECNVISHQFSHIRKTHIQQSRADRSFWQFSLSFRNSPWLLLLLLLLYRHLSFLFCVHILLIHKKLQPQTTAARQKHRLKLGSRCGWQGLTSFLFLLKRKRRLCVTPK